TPSRTGPITLGAKPAGQRGDPGAAYRRRNRAVASVDSRPAAERASGASAHDARPARADHDGLGGRWSTFSERRCIAYSPQWVAPLRNGRTAPPRASARAPGHGALGVGEGERSADRLGPAWIAIASTRWLRSSTTGLVLRYHRPGTSEAGRLGEASP